MLRQKLDECRSKISNIGTIPNTELITKFMSYSSKNVCINYRYIFINTTYIISLFFFKYFSYLKSLNQPM